jgi:hypothetical protein
MKKGFSVVLQVYMHVYQGTGIEAAYGISSILRLILESCHRFANIGITGQRDKSHIVI